MADQIRSFTVSPIETNCYAYISDGECMVVDAGGSGAALAHELADVHVACIVATHGHGDHVGGVAALKRASNAPFLIHAADEQMALHAGEKSVVGIVFEENAPAADRLLSEGDAIEVGSAVFTVIETPGHTPGSICLLGSGSAEGVLFTGDTLFAGSRGRTDFPESSDSAMIDSLARLKREIAPQTTVLCGHGMPTTMERELASNPFLR